MRQKLYMYEGIDGTSAVPVKRENFTKSIKKYRRDGTEETRCIDKKPPTRTMRRNHQHRRPFSSDSDVDFEEDEDELDDEADDEPSAARRRRGKMKCLSCKEDYGDAEAGTCRECYEEAGETEEELKREIDELKSKVNFLRLLCVGQNLAIKTSTPCFSDVVLVASGGLDSTDLLCNSPSIPAHRAVLVLCPLFPHFKFPLPIYRVCTLHSTFTGSSSYQFGGFTVEFRKSLAQFLLREQIVLLE